MIYFSIFYLVTFFCTMNDNFPFIDGWVMIDDRWLMTDNRWSMILDPGSQGPGHSLEYKISLQKIDQIMHSISYSHAYLKFESETSRAFVLKHNNSYKSSPRSIPHNETQIIFGRTLEHLLSLDVLKIIASYAVDHVIRLSDGFAIGTIQWYYMIAGLDGSKNNYPAFVVDDVTIIKNINLILKELQTIIIDPWCLWSIRLKKSTHENSFHRR